MSEIRQMLEASMARLLAQQWDAAQCRRNDSGWPHELWDKIAELGLPRAMVCEDRGGGLTLAEGLGLQINPTT